MNIYISVSLCPVPLPGILTVLWFTTSAVKIAACVQRSSQTCRPETPETLSTESPANEKTPD